MKKLFSGILVSISVGFIIFMFAKDIGLDSVTFSFWTNWLLMFWAYAMHRINLIHLPDAYFTPKPFEPQILKAVGVKYYQRIIRKISIFNPELKLEQGSRDLSALEQATRNAEQAHLLIFVIMLSFTFFALIKGWWVAVFWCLLFNLLLNAYPVLVQRYNRIRIFRVSRLMNRTL